MKPEDLEFIRTYRRSNSRESKDADGGSFFGELFGHAIIYAVGFALFLFLSQRWSWIVFMSLGVVLMLGIPTYFLLRRR